MFAAGQSQKSVWYRFSIPSKRSVKVTLAQPGSAIAAGDVGFAVYKTAACLPGSAQISTQLTPIGLFGNSLHPCLDVGDYLVQVCAKQGANGPVFIQVNIDTTNALYDHPRTAYAFGTLVPGLNKLDYEVECQSVLDATETCPILHNAARYNKSTWHVFTMPAYFDALAVRVATQVLTNRTFGYRLYDGDVRSQPFGSLPVLDGCDSMVVGPESDRRVYGCDRLQPGRTYSLQLLFDQDFKDRIAVGVQLSGERLTKAPRPVSSAIPAANNLGVLPSATGGATTTVSDDFGCNARHGVQPCGNTRPVDGVRVDGHRFNLSTFFRFTLSTTSDVDLYSNLTPCAGYTQPLLRIYNRDVTNSCSDLDTSHIIGTFRTNGTLPCLPPGNYTVQVMGSDSLGTRYGAGGYWNIVYGSHLCEFSALGSRVNLQFTVRSVNPGNRFSLANAPAVDRINTTGSTLQPMVPGTWYTHQPDTFGCANSVLPADTTCSPNGYQPNTKGVFRTFSVADSGMLQVFGANNHYSRYYAGDAAALATAQGVNAFPQRITGLQAITECVTNSGYWCGTPKSVCITPGTYTLVTFGSNGNKGSIVSGQQRINTATTRFHSPATAEDMGDLNARLQPSGGTLNSAFDIFSCRDNAIPINGYLPPKIQIPGSDSVRANKAIFRQFYLSSPSKVGIQINWQDSCNNIWGAYMRARLTLFSGRISAGTAGLQPMPEMWRNFQNINASECRSSLPAGWYTVVTYDYGQSYGNAEQKDRDQYLFGIKDRIAVTIQPDCPAQKYNRPHKAAVDTLTREPFLIQWGPNAGHTAAYPSTHRIYALPRETFNCSVDTPFSARPVIGCDPGSNRLVFYVFRTTQVGYLEINTQQRWAAVYAMDVRKDSALLTSRQPVQPCNKSNGMIQICRAQPGVYTLVVFADDRDVCNYLDPTIYIDDVGGRSRFDHANNAYDFGVIPSDSTYYLGRPGDVNPLNPGRAPSHDFIYCSTGSQSTDPDQTRCGTTTLPAIYSDTANTLMAGSGAFDAGHSSAYPRRNLWYTFQVRGQGMVRVRVLNKAPGKRRLFRYDVFRSDVDGSIPFSGVVSGGQVDSTIAQGLTRVASAATYYYCTVYSTDVDFLQTTCDTRPVRYYILVETPNPYPDSTHLTAPNGQVEVAVLANTRDAVQPRFDHYSQPGVIGTALGTGTHAGPVDNTSCATRGTNETFTRVTSSGYNTCAQRTLWYRFTSAVTGRIQYRYQMKRVRDGSTQWNTDFYLLRQLIPGDSTDRGLQFLEGNSIWDSEGNWMTTCLQAGQTYYFYLPNCNDDGAAEVMPQIKIVEQQGDLCSRPVTAILPGASSVMATAVIDCHTIGTDYGEFNPNLTCPQGAETFRYKTSWFRIQITGTDTLDVTSFITENTNASSSEIKYRLMNGTCGAMQERSCVQDALTQDTYKCLAPGVYFVQVFTPVVTSSGSPTTGSIDLRLSAVKHQDTCAPAPPCLVTSAFIPRFDCNTTDSVSFENLSTYGSDITYRWDFGHGGATSTAVSPFYRYPALTTSQTYTVKLVVTNTACNRKDSSTATITIPARPVVDLGPDRVECTPGTYTLNAASWPATTYQWSTGQTTPTISTTSTGTYWVAATFAGCTRRDTINLSINPIQPRSQTYVICGNQTVDLNSFRYQGETYRWSTGALTGSINVGTPGLYTNRIDWRGCTMVDSFAVLSPPSPFGGRDTVICHPMRPITLQATVPSAQDYSWDDGVSGAQRSVSTPGTYRLTINFGNCTRRDSIRVLVTAAPVDSTRSVSVCAGQPFTLPWGAVVTASGTYRDTLRYTTGCDSLRRSVTVAVQPLLRQSLSGSFCAGSGYTLPTGRVVTTPGVYVDTVRYRASGCDSLIRTVTVSEATVREELRRDTACQGSGFVLPSGRTVTAEGTYRDTLRYAQGGCDSLRRTVILTVQSAQTRTTDTVICTGQSYTLPWGAVVTAAGVYRDTLRYTTGCDSLRRTVNLRVQTFTVQQLQATFCAGAAYTLPWGLSVTEPGLYRDTLRYATGCDSVRRTVTLIRQEVSTQQRSDTVCAGSSFVLPWGRTVTASGTYRDTLRYTTGCDSLRRTVILTVQVLREESQAVAICTGGSHTLPWGQVVRTAGLYRDTLRYGTGCDSVRRTVTLTVTPPAVAAVQQVSICADEVYRLPWGMVVSTAGVYRDTLRTASGCDSLIRTVRLEVRPLPAVRADWTNDINCVLSVTRLQASGAVSYRWRPGGTLSDSTSAEPVARPQVTTRYVVEGTGANGCRSRDSVVVTVNFADDPLKYLVASAFTPNGDGRNDCFGVRHWGDVTGLQLQVFNRYGSLVYETKDPRDCWDGRYKGIPQPTGVFVYIIRAEGPCGEVLRKGTVTLIR